MNEDDSAMASDENIYALVAAISCFGFFFAYLFSEYARNSGQPDKDAGLDKGLQVKMKRNHR